MPRFIDCDIRMYANINIGEAHNKTLKQKQTKIMREKKINELFNKI